MHNILKKVILLGVVYDTVYELLLCIISIVDVYLPVILSSRRTLASMDQVTVYTPVCTFFIANVDANDSVVNNRSVTESLRIHDRLKSLDAERNACRMESHLN